MHKNQFGHVLILAGSQRMLGAAALTGLAAMRSGAGLVTIGIPAGLNLALQKKISPEIMTWPLPETACQSLSSRAGKDILIQMPRYAALALGPGLSTDLQTRKLVLEIIGAAGIPMVIDADALNALAGHLEILKNTRGVKVLTPHPGEMARLCRCGNADIETDRKAVAIDFARRYQCTVILKGHHSVIAGPTGSCVVNKTGNPGMATAGSGDVLTGMVAALLGQGLDGFSAGRWGARIHGLAGDLAAKKQGRAALIASDIIASTPQALRALSRPGKKDTPKREPGR